MLREMCGQHNSSDVSIILVYIIIIIIIIIINIPWKN